MKCTCDIQQLFHGDNGCTCGAMQRERGKAPPQEKKSIQEISAIGAITGFKPGMYVRVVAGGYKGKIGKLSSICTCSVCVKEPYEKREWNLRLINFVICAYHKSAYSGTFITKFDTVYPRPDEVWIKRSCDKLCTWHDTWLTLNTPGKLNKFSGEADPTSSYGRAAKCGCLQPFNFGCP